jgi:hypothetical protein
MKVCIRCYEKKPLAEYYRHPRMADGHLNKCKGCCKVYARHSHRANSGDTGWVEKERARGRDKYHRLYAPTDPLLFVTQDAPEGIKARARTALRNAVRDGKVKRPNECERCGGAGGRIHGHHADYFKPLDVEWLCVGCHSAAHRVPASSMSKSA